MFKGTTGFAKGEWYGIELDLPEGKHDGYIKKDMKRYFKAKKNHGTFVQRKKIVALAGKTKQTAPVSAPTSPKEDEPTPAVDVAVVEEEKKRGRVSCSRLFVCGVGWWLTETPNRGENC